MSEKEDEVGAAGEPGEPGKPGTRGTGGEGGAGGAGGEGGETGGVGGAGGTGGEYSGQLGHAPIQATEEAKEEARQEITAEIDNGIAPRRKSWLTLLAVSILAGSLLGAAFFIRSYSSDQKDVALCEKLDRFVVKIEQRTLMNPELTDEQARAALKFYEDFRNDEPMCRTGPAPSLETRP